MKAANVNVESYWPSLFAKLAEKRSIEDLVMNVGAGGGGGAVAVTAQAAGGAAAEAKAPVEEKKVYYFYIFNFFSIARMYYIVFGWSCFSRIYLC